MHTLPTLSFVRATSAAQSRTALLLPSPSVTTLSGVTPGHARFDTPPPGAEEVSLERSQRARKETQLGELWRQELCPKSTRKTNPRPIASTSNASMPSRSMPLPAVPPSVASSSVASRSASTVPAATTSTKTAHALFNSEFFEFDREDLIEQLSHVLDQDCTNLPTQELQKMLETLQDSQAASHAPKERETQNQTIVHPPESLNVGGGFHLTPRHMSESPEAPPIIGSKRANVNARKPHAKRARVTGASEGTDTEDEDDSGQPPAPPSNAIPLRFASPRVSHSLSGVLGASPGRSSTSARTTSGSDRPVGLPRSTVAATAPARPAGLPVSSTAPSTEVQATVVPSSVSPDPVPSQPASAPLPIPAPTTQAPTPPDRPLDVEELHSLLGLALDLTKKAVLDAPTRPQDPLDNAANEAYIRAVEVLRNRLQSALHLGQLAVANSGTPPPLEPHPLVQPPTLVAATPDIIPDNEESLRATAAAQSRTRNTSKPAMRDYPGNVRQVLTSAVLDLLAYICAEGPYETRRTNLIWSLEAVQRSWAREFPGVPPEIVDQNALRLLSARAAWLRGLVRDRLRLLVIFLYNLHNPPLNAAQRRENQQIIGQALPNAFHCFDIFQPRSRQYEHPIVQRAIATALFYSPDAIGAVYHMYFDPMPLPTVAFILTTIQFCLEEWETGAFKAKELRAERQYNTYCAHLRGLQQYDTAANTRLTRFRQRWFDFAIQHSGASVAAPVQTQEITDAADVRPDTPDNTPESSPEL